MTLRVPAIFCLFLPTLCADDAKLLPGGDHRELVAKACIRCHGSVQFRKVRLTEDQWWGVVAGMVRRGATASQEEQARIVSYLASHFGRDAKVLMNSAPAGEMAAILKFPPAIADAIVDYRADYGDFQQPADLLKVRGVTAAMVEAARDRMEF